MPSYERIESFAKQLLQLGGEPEYLRKNGEPVAVIERPSEEINLEVDDSLGGQSEMSSAEFLKQLEEREKEEDAAPAAKKPATQQEDDIFGSEGGLVDDFLYDAAPPDSSTSITYELSPSVQEASAAPSEEISDFEVDADALSSLGVLDDIQNDDTDAGGMPDVFSALEDAELAASAEGAEDLGDVEGAEQAIPEDAGTDFDLSAIGTDGDESGEVLNFAEFSGGMDASDEDISDISEEDLASLQAQLETYEVDDEIVDDVDKVLKASRAAETTESTTFTDELSFESPTKASSDDVFVAPDSQKSDRARGVETLDQLKVSEEDYQKILETSRSLPLNLRKIVFQIIVGPAEKPEHVSRLIRSLLAGASINNINRLVHLITGTRVVIPWGYEKQWVGDQKRREDLRRKRKFGKRSKIALRITLGLFSIIFTGLVLLTYVYRPIVANTLYKRGYTLVSNGEHRAGNETFLRAWNTRSMPKWLMRYADSFIEQSRYDLAEEKYDQLIYGTDEELRDILIQKTAEKQLYELYVINKRYARPIEYINLDRDGIFAHAHLQSNIIGNYARAEQLLSLLLGEDKFDYEALLASGDNYINWGDEDATYYENARVSYTTLLSEYGDDDEILMRMLWYFTRIDNKTRADEISQRFLVSSRKEINPEIYAEYAGYLMERHNTIDTVRDILLRINDVDSQLPELHYYSAMYNRMANDDSGREKTLLENALALFDAIPEPSIRRIKRMLDARVRLGEYYYREENYLDAERELQRAREGYEVGLDEQRFGHDAEIARLYAVLGDIRYYDGRRNNEALDQYLTSIDHGYITPQLQYKIGNIYYRRKDYDQAIEYFLDTEKVPGMRHDNELQYAIANTLFYLGNYNVAESYYRLLLGAIEQLRRDIPVGFTTDAPKHRLLIEYLIRINNNLGVVLNHISERNGGITKNNQAMLYLQNSMKYTEDLSRDPVTKIRDGNPNLAYLNMRSILYEQAGFEPSIYTNIPIDLETAFSNI